MVAQQVLEAKFEVLPVMLLLMVLNYFLHQYPKTKFRFVFVSQRTRLNWCFTLHIGLSFTVKEYTLPSMVKYPMYNFLLCLSKFRTSSSIFKKTAIVSGPGGF